mmetsp:Transcript_16893/g.33785  ORF Transcript_16893/g.33785 Transcript_16893/m.33785 type:complete len:275 (+) Transcript_16893:17-841(+)
MPLARVEIVMRAASHLIKAIGARLEVVGLDAAAATASAASGSASTEVPFGNKTPAVSQNTFIAPNSSLIGNVTLGEGVGIWYNSVLRADVNRIEVGARSQLEDRVVVHVAKFNGDLPTIIGENVHVGPGCTIHACTLENNVSIGAGATVLDGAVVKEGARVGAGSTVTPGTVVGAGELWEGVPARKVRNLEQGESQGLAEAAVVAQELSLVHAAECGKSPEVVAQEAHEHYLSGFNLDLALHPNPATRQRPGVLFDSDFRGPRKDDPDDAEEWQ